MPYDDPAKLADHGSEWDRLSEAFRSDAQEWDLWYLTRFSVVAEAFRSYEQFSCRQTNYNIEEFASDGHCDVVTQLARRFPTSVFMEMMGLPLEESDKFLDWASDLLQLKPVRQSYTDDLIPSTISATAWRTWATERDDGTSRNP